MGKSKMKIVKAKVTPEEKAKFKEVCNRIGCTPSEAIRMFVVAFNREKGFTFPVCECEIISESGNFSVVLDAELVQRYENQAGRIGITVEELMKQALEGYRVAK